MEKFNNYKPVRLIELFAGIGAQAKALENLGVNFEHWRVCEFDEHAVRSYNAVHNTHFVPSDITKISADDLGITNTDEFTYLLTYSFPCQDLSNAGKGAGMEKGSGTRSGLLWEVERLLNECTELPQVLLMENVPQVHGKKNIDDFNKWIAFLESKGYSNYWKDLNAKDYGVPQNRKRCYMVSILGEFLFSFPQSMPLTKTLKDVLDTEVDEKYYLGTPKLNMIAGWKSLERPLQKVAGRNSIARTLTTRSGAECGSLATYCDAFAETTNIEPLVSSSSDLKRTLCDSLLEKGLVEEGDVIRHSYTSNRLNNGVENMARTESKEKLSPTLDTRCDCLGVVVKEDTLKAKVCDQLVDENKVTPYDVIDVSYAQSRLDELTNGTVSIKNKENNQISNTITTASNNFGVCVPSVIGGIGEMKSNGGRQWYQQDRIYDGNCAIGVTPTAQPYYATGEQSLRIRKLTPNECWRLMGFSDEDFARAARVCSNARLYKQAGNSIVVDVLMAIFKELFVPKKTRSQWLDDLLN